MNYSIIFAEISFYPETSKHAFILSSPVSLWYGAWGPASGVICTKHTSHNIEDKQPLLHQIFVIIYIYRVCAKVIVAPHTILNSALLKAILTFNLVL